MANTKFAVEGTIGDYAPKSNGKQYVKPFHAYKCVITRVETTDKMVFVYVQPIDAKGSEYDRIALAINSPYFGQQLGKIAYAIASSLPNGEKVMDSKSVDVAKWQGMKVGVVYQPAKTKESNWKEDGKWTTPHYAISIDNVDTFKPNMDKYNAWYQKFWINDNPANYNDGSMSIAEQESMANRGGAIPEPTFEENDLPF